MAAGAASGGRSLENTPTWALATVCFVFIFTGIIIEHSIHLLTKWLKRHRKRALSDAIERLKSELMLLGFISLLLAVTQTPISKICISSDLADTMLPCRKEVETETTKVLQAYMVAPNLPSFDRFPSELLPHARRHLEEEEEEGEGGGTDETASNNNNTTSTTASNNNDSTTTESDPCASKGKVSLVTQKGIQQLHIFIFVLAVMQIVYSVLTMALGRAKMRRWKRWEKETQTTEYQVANDPNRFRFTRQTTFGRRHMNACTETPLLLWIKCFFRQFFRSVAKVDYLTLRHGFISAHLSTRNNSNFDFQKYIKRSLDEDFKEIVSISPLMWFLVVIFMLVDVHGWNVYLWVSYVPLLLVLVLGTKLEGIVARMALQIKSQNSVVIGTPLVQPNDKLFWFNHPRFVLTILHYTLFVNAFELAFFIWVTIQFGVESCYHEHTVIIVTRVVLAVTVQVMCSYITLPLYALVTQMGSQFKSKVLEEQMANIIKQWHADVRERRKMQELQSSFHSPRTSSSTRPSLSINHVSNKKGEITEDEDDDGSEYRAKERGGDYVEEGAGGSSRGVSWSQPVSIEMSPIR
ncbi:MLO-like protein 3 [Punica granatum]|uniref:MLO-like protein n=1 Tax=Punica granatum TaxID=22663 RepID=A0A6P8CB36_PUNGR|nr:MLO-like protein 3 [Punica granatum]